MPKHLDFKKRERKEIKMRRHTHFLVISEKFWGTQPPTKESIY
jgi:hypothetical protein